MQTQREDRHLPRELGSVQAVSAEIILAEMEATEEAAAREQTASAEVTMVETETTEEAAAREQMVSAEALAAEMTEETAAREQAENAENAEVRDPEAVSPFPRHLLRANR